MIHVLLPLVLLGLLFWLDRRRNPASVPKNRGPATPLPAGLQFRSRVTTSVAEPGWEGYGSSAVAVAGCASSPGENRLGFVSPRRGSCRDLQLQYGGERDCAWACLGEGDCAEICPEGAIRMEQGLPRIDAERCTGCGECVTSCPRGVLHLLPSDAQVHVRCASADPLLKRQDLCSLGCRESGRCLDNRFTEHAVQARDGRRVIDLSRSRNLAPLIGLCPTESFADRIPHRPWFTVNERCTGCGDCLSSCPVEHCITQDGGAAGLGLRARIDPERCVGCGLCVPFCGEAAIRVVGAIGYGFRDEG